MYAAEAEAGETLHAFWFSLPAATEMNTPELASELVALLSADEKPPPSDMFATAGFTALRRTQSSAATMPEVEPEPEQLRTRTPRSRTLFATPQVAPPIVPATCVPCPLQSCPVPPSAS